MTMATSGVRVASHSRAGAYPSNSGFQYGSPVLPRSMAAPIDGTCDVARPHSTSAIATPSRHHRRAELGFAHPGEHPTEVLHRQPVHHGELVHVEDAATGVEHALPVPFEHRPALLGRQREPVAVRRLVGAELGPGGRVL